MGTVNLKCDYCGRFTKAQELHFINFIPDSDYSTESYDTICLKCERKKNKKIRITDLAVT
jgi:hypothetical protein